jgi:hemolysin activation/secretion protein
VAPGGTKIKLERLTFYGNTIFTEAQLIAVAGDVMDKEFDLSGLQEIAERIADFYRLNGYPFARTVLPPQTVGTGRVKVEVIEGRFGSVTAVGDERLAPEAQRWLESLKEGAVIREDTLERATLLLSDQPGIATRPLIKPGERVGTGDLEVGVRRDVSQSVDLGVDNHGSRYTGYQRARGNYVFNSPTMLGDQLLFSGVRSFGHLELANLGYSRPIGYNGMRLQTGIGYTEYKVGRELEAANRGGTANVYNIGLSYPFVRSNKANLTGSVTLNYKDLNDYYKDFNTSSRVFLGKSVVSVPFSAQFDVRDDLFGPAITFGSAIITAGDVRLDATAKASDESSVKTNGRFIKSNLDVIRQQLVGAYTLSTRLSAQYSPKNLDSSEDFLLGGPSGVRAYPNGEASGDRGVIYQLELRRQVDLFTPYVFYDGGRIETNSRAYSLGHIPKQRQGGGVGVRYTDGKLSLDGIAARRVSGGSPESDPYANAVQYWLTMNYHF